MIFSHGPIPLGFTNPTKEEMQTGLDALQTCPPRESVVVYLASYALIDAKGMVQLLAKDSDPDNFGTLLPLGQVLGALRRLSIAGEAAGPRCRQAAQPAGSRRAR